MRFTARPIRLLISVSAAVLCLVAVISIVVLHRAEPLRKLDLNDSGIWVTNDVDGLVGRLNKSAGSLDTYFNPPGGAQASYRLDVVQDGGAVVAYDRGGGRLIPVDPATGATVPDDAVTVPPNAQVAMSKGTLAVLDPAVGKLWAVRYDIEDGPVSVQGLDSSLPALADLGAPIGTPGETSAALAVDVRGGIHAASTNRKLAMIDTAPDGFKAPVLAELDGSWSTVQISTVGTRAVVLDAAAQAIAVDSGQRRTMAALGQQAILQQPGPDADRVIVASSTTLLSVDLDNATTTNMFEGGTGTPAAPLVLGGCEFGAWAGRPGAVARSCAGVASALRVDRSGTLLRPVFRSNRGQLVVNDAQDGRVFDLDLRKSLDNWEEIKPPQDERRSTKENRSQQVTKKEKPQAHPDRLGARSDRTTVLHVLDNDTDPAGRILAIESVTRPAGMSERDLRISPDGQTLLYTLGSAASDQSFRYTIGNATGATDSTTVSVEVRGSRENEAPARRKLAEERPSATVAGSAATVPVLDEWRDFDGDPISVVAVDAARGSATADLDGRLTFHASNRAGPVKIDFDVSDGRIDQPVEASVTVDVLSTKAEAGVSAVANPDVVRAVVGRPVVAQPLANDRPGADPTDDDAHLELGGNVSGPASTEVSTDQKAGTVNFTAKKAGAYLLTYTAAYGNTKPTKGSVRVDAINPPDQPEQPIAMPDAVTVRGQSALTFDVLANDVDPAGSVLTVEAAVADHPDQVAVAVLSGRWLRLTPLVNRFDESSQVLHYRVTNGITAPVSGSVTLSQLPALAPDPPVVQDDTAVVRAGDQVVVPVLDNDSTVGGAPLRLLTDVEDAPAAGQLAVSAGAGRESGAAAVGNAYATSSAVRYVAPQVSEQISVSVDYVAETGSGERGTGTLDLTVVPTPTADRPNRPPTPESIEARAVSGQTVVVPVPGTGRDPDGDSTTVVGIASAPTLGRVLGFSPTGIRYQSYPQSAGTDAFSYVVTDRFGATRSASVRIAVTLPAAPQPAAAVPDSITAAPGATVRVNALANDLYDRDDQVTIAPLAQTNQKVPEGASVETATGPVTAVVPGADADPLELSYAIEGSGGGSSSTVTVRPEEGYNNPPVAYDQVVTLTDGSGVADPLAQAWDPDGDADAITLTSVAGAQASIQNGKVVIQGTAEPQSVAYQIADADGATATATIHVPAVGSGPPYAKTGASISAAPDAVTAVNLPDYVLSPRGRAVRLTTKDRMWASPVGKVSINPTGNASFKVTTKQGYVGPAAVTVEVSDGASLTDPEGLSSVVTIPVQVGPVTPVLRCPTTPMKLIEGGRIVSLKVAALCHVWTANPDDAAGLTYSADWDGSADGLAVTGAGSDTLVVEAATGAAPGSEGVLRVGVDGSSAEPAQLRFTVIAAPKPVLRPVVLEGVRQGSSRTVALKDVMRSQLRDPQFTAISARQLSGQPATITAAGGEFDLVPAAASSGPMTFEIVASDQADVTRVDRQVTGLISLVVFGVPDAPTALEGGKQLESESATLTWKAGSSNGAPVRYFDVTGGGVTQRCPSSPCTVRKLTNGKPVTFTVRAFNRAGWSTPSAPSDAITPDAVPPTVTGLRVGDPLDHRLTLGWSAPEVNGTPIQAYRITWSGGRLKVAAPATSAVVRGLENNQIYTFSVVAINGAGPGRSVSAKGQSSGRPGAVPAPQLDARDGADNSEAVVGISWDEPDANGPSPLTYSVTRTGPGGSQVICASTTKQRCSDDGVNYNGSTYRYAVSATNDTGGEAHTSKGAAAAYVAVGKPAGWGRWSATETGAEGEVELKFTVPPSRGAKSKVNLLVDRGNPRSLGSYSPSGEAGRETVRIDNGVSQDLQLQVCNEDTCTTSDSESATPYGPFKELAVTDVSSNGVDYSYRVSVNANGRAGTVTVNGESFETDRGVWSRAFDGRMGCRDSKTISVEVKGAGRDTKSTSERVSTHCNPSLAVSKGGSYKPSYCTTAPCARINVSGSQFEPGASYTLYYSTDCAGPHGVQCRGGVNGGTSHYFQQTVQADSNGNISTNDRAFGYPGASVWVEIDAWGDHFESNHQLW